MPEQNPRTIARIIDQIVTELRHARRLLFITGAGMSADSGLPTYRGIGGLYNNKLTDDELPIEVALSGGMMARSPHITWKYIYQIERACRGAHHNDGHRIIAALEDCFESVCVLTQNVDGFHRAAGSRNLIEIHGNIHDLYCMTCDCDYKRTVVDYAVLTTPPPCPRCGGLLRPDVVLFGEWLPERAVVDLHEQLALGFDMVLSVGTTSTFPYIAEPVIEARRAGVPTVEINPGETVISDLVDFKLSAGAALCLTRLWERLQKP